MKLVSFPDFCHNTYMTLSDFGYQHYLHKLGAIKSKHPTARIIAENKTDWNMISEKGKLKGIIMTSFRKNMLAEQLPKVGDYVEYEPLPNEAKGKITKVLPRFSELARQLTEQQNQTQILATNVDKLIIVSGLDQDFRLDQLRRYLALAASANIETLLVINKTDLNSKAGAREIAVKKIFPNLLTVHTSTKTQIGIATLKARLQPEQTVVFIGSSGAGKSSLINLLITDTEQNTKTVRVDGKGRHTTTRREMFLIPSGAIVVDTPGIRTLEINVSSDELPIDDIIAELARDCRFRDCDHLKTKYCAVIAALNEKLISDQQYQNFIKLLHDAKRSEEKYSPRLIQERKTKQRAQSKAIRQLYKSRKPPKR